MGPRPAGRGWATLSGYAGRSTMPLQWGRDLPVADGRDVGAVCGDRDDTSMGPRPAGRGWKAETPAFDGWTKLLQWGRDLPVADGPMRRYTSMTVPYFNGAATCRSRMDGVVTVSVPLPPNTSMGPRPAGRGWGLQVPDPALRDLDFNGAATCRSRMGACRRS